MTDVNLILIYIKMQQILPHLNDPKLEFSSHHLLMMTNEWGNFRYLGMYVCMLNWMFFVFRYVEQDVLNRVHEKLFNKLKILTSTFF